MPIFIVDVLNACAIGAKPSQSEPTPDNVIGTLTYYFLCRSHVIELKY
jgi:hypothetical protein